MLEDQLEGAKQKISELTSELSATKSQLAQARVQQEALVSALRVERQSKAPKSRHKSDSINRNLRHDLPDGYFRSLNDMRVHRDSCDQETQSWDGEVEDPQGWHGNVGISVHPALTNRKKPATLKTRLNSNDDTSESPLSEDSEGRLITSTPVENEKPKRTLALAKENNSTRERSHSDGFVVENKSREKDQVCQGCKDSSDSMANNDESDLNYQAFHKTVPGQNKQNAAGTTEENRVRNVKRDSGIIIDQSPTSSS